MEGKNQKYAKGHSGRFFAEVRWATERTGRDSGMVESESALSHKTHPAGVLRVSALSSSY